jgi:hypothetical protein
MQSLQIDLKPLTIGSENTSYFMDLIIDGITHRSIISQEQADKMVQYKIVSQVKRQVNNEKGKLETRDYPEKVDGAGVRYTSKVYELIEKKFNS